MPALANPRHERFARHYMKTGNAAASYLKAGYSPSSRESLDPAASKLTRHDKVQRRIRELQKQMAARNRITVDSLVEELDEAKALALKVDQPSAAITATMSKAKLVGLLVERRESGAPGDFSGLHSEAEVMDVIRQQLGEEVAQQLAQALQKPAEEPALPAPEEVDPLPIEPTAEGSSTLQ